MQRSRYQCIPPTRHHYHGNLNAPGTVEMTTVFADPTARAYTTSIRTRILSVLVSASVKLWLLVRGDEVDVAYFLEQTQDVVTLQHRVPPQSCGEVVSPVELHLRRPGCRRSGWRSHVQTLRRTGCSSLRCGARLGDLYAQSVAPGTLGASSSRPRLDR